MVAAHGNRLLPRSAARSAVRICAASFLALLICGAVLSLRPPAEASPAGPGLGATMNDGTEDTAGTVSGAAMKGKQKDALGSGEEAGRLRGGGGTLVLQVRA